MNCDEVRRHWDLYYDSEGDAEVHLQVNEHLESCPACARWFFQQNRIEILMTDKLKATAAPTEALWRDVLQRSDVRQARSRRWINMPSVMLLAASVLIVVAGFLLFQVAATSTDGPDLARLTADYHRRLVDGQVRVQFASHSDMDVEQYLLTRVTFPVRCPPRKDSGFAVAGTGILRLGETDATCVFGSVDNVPVSIFVLPRGSLPMFPRQSNLLQAASAHACREGAFEMVMAPVDQNVVLVVGATNRDKLRRVLTAYGSYGHHGDERSA